MTESPEKKTSVERAEALTDERLKLLEARRQDAMEAVRKFMEAVDEAIPNFLDPSIRKKIVDSALELADRLSTTQLEFLRGVSGTVSEALTPRSPGSTPPSKEVHATQRELSD